jgi:ribosomal protein S18 acetylase RimI-like enzyme
MLKADINIRQAVPTDAPELLSLIRAAMAVYARRSGITTPLESQLETEDDLLAHIATDHVLVAVHCGRLTGTVRLVRCSDGSACFSRFAVLPHFERSGVGGMVYQAAEDWLKSAAIRTVRLHTALTNKALVAFYEARGFCLEKTSAERGYPRGTFRKDLIP